MNKDIIMASHQSIEQQRSYVVAKANRLIQNSKFKVTDQGNMSLSAQQQKIVLYLISKIKPDETSHVPVPISFNMRDFLMVCGYNNSGIGGRNLKLLRAAIDDLADKHMWIMDEKNTETHVRWIDDVSIDHNLHAVIITFDKTFWPFLVNLANNYTSFPLKEILLLKSGRSIILYELLRSYAFMDRPIQFEYAKLYWKLMDTDKYLNNAGWFFQQVIDPAVDEINLYTLLKVRVEKIRETGRGRKIVGCRFFVKLLSGADDTMSEKQSMELALREELIDTSLYDDAATRSSTGGQHYVEELKSDIRKLN